jgi:hypothetical protein
MKVGELLALLRRYNPETEVRIAHQPHWPFSYELAGVVSDDEVRKLDGSVFQSLDQNRLWLVEGALDAAIDDTVWRAMVKKRAS